MGGMHCTECGVSNAPHLASCSSAPRVSVSDKVATANLLAKARSYTEAFLAAGENSDKVEPLADAVRDLKTAAIEYTGAQGARRPA